MRNFTETLIDEYTNDNNIINLVADRAIWTNGEVQYSILKNIVEKKSFTEDNLIYFLLACVITAHIPLYSDGQRVDRPLKECAKDALTFIFTRIDEDDLEEYSQTSTKIPALSRHDNSDNMFKSGTGNRLADFEAKDDPSIIIDAKYIDPNTKSRSTWHDANKALCKDSKGAGMYSYYELTPDKHVDMNTEVWLTDFIPCDRNYRAILDIFSQKYSSLFTNLDTTITRIDQAIAEMSHGEFKWRE